MKNARLLFFGERKGKRAAVVVFAGDLHDAAVAFHDMLDDAQAQARAAGGAAASLVHPIKALEDTWDIMGQHADSCVRD